MLHFTLSNSVNRHNLDFKIIPVIRKLKNYQKVMFHLQNSGSKKLVKLS